MPVLLFLRFNFVNDERFIFTGQQTTITVNVLTPTDFPVDLYYLTDVSRSIEKESIKRLGQLLGNWSGTVGKFNKQDPGRGQWMFTNNVPHWLKKKY